MRSAYLVLIAGCGFSSPGSPVDPGGGSGGPGDTGGDGSGAPVRSVSKCDAKDPSLRLCLTFDQPPTMVQDVLDPPHVLATGTGVKSILGILQNAAKLDGKSRIRFAADPDFDVPELTIEMWIAPDALGEDKQFSILDSDAQYHVALDGDRTVRCGVGAVTSVTSNAKLTGPGWHHVACVYTAAHQLRVHVDGAVSGCTAGAGAIPPGGPIGLAIGASYGADGTVTDNFLGGIDGVHVYGRALTEGEICGDAQKTGCSAACPSEG